MVITQPAVDVLSLDFSGSRLVSEFRARARRIMPWLTSVDDTPLPAVAVTGPGPSVKEATDLSEVTPVMERSSTSTPTPAPLDARERRARAAAVRGLMHARQCRFVLAQEAFAEGLKLDAALDLLAVPTFWDMPRGGQEAAVRAYEQVGRIRDAATLAATIRRTFTPRPVPLRRPVSTAAPSTHRG